MAARGRPRKVSVLEELPEDRIAQQIIAEATDKWCYIPGCTARLHLEEASSIIGSLKENGYEIRKMK